MRDGRLARANSRKRATEVGKQRKVWGKVSHWTGLRVTGGERDGGK